MRSFRPRAQPPPICSADAWNFRAKARFVIFSFYLHFIRTPPESTRGSYFYNNNIHFQLLRARFSRYSPAMGAASRSFSLAHSLSTFIFHLAIFMHRFNPHIHTESTGKGKIFTEFSARYKNPFFLLLCFVFGAVRFAYFFVYFIRNQTEARTKEEIF